MSAPGVGPAAWPVIDFAADFRREPEDFEVEETLGFEPDGDGEHLLVRVEKRGLDTAEVAALLARHAGVRRAAVSWAGRKDRHAVARQWFSIGLAGRADPDLAALAGPKLAFLRVERHRRKLRPGALAGNRFRLRLRAVRGARDAAEERLRLLAAQGAPNYFGPQRFGRDGGNVAAARAALSGGPRRLPRERRSILFSAARAWLFNRVLAERVEAGNWNRLLAGELAMLEGSRSFFRAEAGDASLEARLAAFDISPSGPLVGAEAPRPDEDALAVEERALAGEAELAAALAAAGVRGARRSLRLRPAELEWRWEGDDLNLSFALPAGTYATTLVAELLQG